MNHILTKRIIYTFFLLSTFFSAYSRSIRIPSSVTFIQRNFASPIITGGDTLLLEAGKRKGILFQGIHGLPGKPVVIINTGGIVEICDSTLHNHAVRFYSCRYIKLTGKGIDSLRYGIHIQYSPRGAHGLTIENFSDHFEIEFIKISNAGFAGIMAKTDHAGKDWVLSSLSIHDTHIENTQDGEGMYIGHSFWTKENDEHNIDSLQIFRNTIVNTAAEGIQVGCTYSGNADIYDNIIRNYGTKKATFADFQGNGVQLGNGFSGTFFNNIIDAGKDTLSQSAINILGTGNIFIYKNYIISPNAFAIYSGYQTIQPDKPVYILQNAFINPGSGIVQYDPRISLKSYYCHNIVINPNVRKLLAVQSGKLDTTGNHVHKNPAHIKSLLDKNFQATKLTMKNKEVTSVIRRMELLSDEQFFTRETAGILEALATDK